MSMCLRRLTYSPGPLFAHSFDPFLSYVNVVACYVVFNSFAKFLSQATVDAHSANAVYSASMELGAIVFYDLLVVYMVASPNLSNTPVGLFRIPSYS